MTGAPVTAGPDCSAPERFICVATAERSRKPLSAGSTLGSNLFCLYVVHFVNYLVPLVTVPFLARILNTAAWGEYSFVESTCRYVSLLVEYGFALSATREIARQRDDLGARAQLLASVLGAQFCISVCALSIGAIWACNSQLFHRHPAMFAAGACLAVFEGAGLMWYYQGLERTKSIASIEVVSKTCGVMAIFVLVHRPSDAWKVLALRAGAALITLTAALIIAYRDVPFLFPRPAWILETLRRGGTMFMFRSSTALSTVANIIVLGLVARPEIVGFYAAADKISKATMALLTPITQALYPRIANVVQGRRGHADRFARLGFALMTGGGVILGVALFLAAPLIVHTFFGTRYEPAIMVLRVLAFLHPVMAVNNMLGIQWMLPLRLDGAFNLIVLAGGVLNVALAATLPHWLAQLGPAWAVLTAQALVMTSIVITLYRKQLLPFRAVQR